MEQKNIEQTPQLLTKYELAKFLKVHFSTLDTMLKRGLPHMKVNKMYRFNLAEVLAWMKVQND